MNAVAQRAVLLLVVSMFVIASTAGMRADDPLASPESVGFSTAGLKAFQQAMRGLVDDAKLAGVTTLVARHGKVVHFDAYGVQDLDTKKLVFNPAATGGTGRVSTFRAISSRSCRVRPWTCFSARRSSNRSG